MIFSEKGTLSLFGRLLMKFKFSFPIDSITSPGGVPSNSVISEYELFPFPGNNGFPSSISAKIQPALQISTASLKLCSPSKNSGARYPIAFGNWIRAVARPKSQIFRSAFSLMRMSEGFKSRWMTPAE